MLLFLTVVAGVPFAIVFHELGHVVAARLAGMQIQVVSFGSGNVLAKFHSVAGAPLIVRWPLIPGVTIPVEPWLIGPGRLAAFTLGGIVATLCAMALGIWVLSFSGNERRWIEAVGLGLVISNAILLPPALFSGVSDSRQDRSSELVLAFRLLRGKVGSTAFAEAWAQTFPQEYGRVGATLSDLQIAQHSGDAKLTAEARQRLERRANDGQLPTSTLIQFFDVLATAGLIEGDPKALEKMDEWTSALIEMAPDDPSIIGSRGAGLVAIGRSEEGVALLKKTNFNEKEQVFEALMTMAFLARGLADLGDHAAAAAGISSARRLLGDESVAARPGDKWGGLDGMVDRLEAEIAALAPR